MKTYTVYFCTQDGDRNLKSISSYKRKTKIGANQLVGKLAKVMNINVDTDSKGFLSFDDITEDGSFRSVSYIKERITKSRKKKSTAKKRNIKKTK